MDRPGHDGRVIQLQISVSIRGLERPPAMAGWNGRFSLDLRSASRSVVRSVRPDQAEAPIELGNFFIFIYYSDSLKEQLTCHFLPESSWS